MQYRTLPHGGEKISIIGLGMGSIHQASVEETERTVRAAIDAGVNFMDFIPSEAVAFEGYARVLRGQRDKVMLQIHLGADYSSGSYGFTTDFATAKSQFEARLAVLDTDYADFGFIHCIDEDADFDQVMNGGIWDYACRMKQEGVIRHLGFSTHAWISPSFPGDGGNGFGHVQHQPDVRLHVRVRVRQRRSGRSRRTVSRIRAWRRGHIRYEGVCGRTAAGCAPVSVRPGAHAIPVHAVRARPSWRAHRAAGYPRRGRFTGGARFPGRNGRRARLFRARVYGASVHGRRMRLLQIIASRVRRASASAWSTSSTTWRGWATTWPHSTIATWRCMPPPACNAGTAMTLSFWRGAERSHAGDCRVFWRIGEDCRNRVTLVSFGDDGAIQQARLCAAETTDVCSVVPCLSSSIPRFSWRFSSVQRPGGLKADLRQKLKADMKTPCGWTKVRHRAFA